MTVDLVGNALFREVQNKRSPAGFINHSDRGQPVLLTPLSSHVKQFGMRSSMSGSLYLLLTLDFIVLH
ncbi:MAG: hypothetical protein Q7S71_04935 [Candidatus Nitrotoga sp.]|nr:hypothetical protein [Candidatus Nitrotoga sp.]